MALKRIGREKSDWNSPTWPERLPLATAMRTAYNPLADELTIRFGDEPRKGAIVYTDYVATPETWYAGVLVRWETGEIIGIQVDYLTDYAVGLHPRWQAVMSPSPEPEVIANIVTDIKELFDRYGVGGFDEE